MTVPFLRPYIAVIKDSFREALASRVLWIILCLITLLLLAIAPIGLNERRATQLRAGTISDWPGLIAKLKSQGTGTEYTPGKRVWELLQEDVKEGLAALPANPSSEQVTHDITSLVVADLNRLLNDRGLYDETTWRGVALNKEAGQLVERGVSKLPEEDLARLNRLLLEAAFPGEIEHSNNAEVHFAYLTWEVEEPLPIPQSQVIPVVNMVLAGFMSIFLGVLAVMGAILVTAAIIPHTFEAGAIDLLLSKPISRSLLFLSKFIGGCAFIFLNVSYFIVGLWLIVGARFGLWSGRLLLCVPIFLFLFAIYYSVSALAGVLWRNAIVAVVMTVLFWAACFAVKTTKNAIEQNFLVPNRVVRIVPAGDSLIAANERGDVLEWRGDERKWEELVEDDNEPRAPVGVAPPMLGPVFDQENDRIVAIETPWSGGFGFGVPESKLVIWNRAESWSRRLGPTPPRGSVGLFVSPQQELVIVTRQSVHRLTPAGSSDYADLGPEPPVRLAPPFAAAISPDTGALALWNHGTLMLLERHDSGKYRAVREKEMDESKEAALLAYAGSTLLVALGDGRIWVVDATDLSVRNRFQPEGRNQPRFAVAAPGGRWFAVVFHHQRVWLFDAASVAPVGRNFVGRGDISAATFTEANRLLLVDHGTRGTVYELEPFRMAARYVPVMGLLERIYRYAVLPVYTVFPKPGELDNMVAYVLTDTETTALGFGSENLSSTRVKLNVKGPLWSSLAFVAVVLGVTCLYIRRADF